MDLILHSANTHTDQRSKIRHGWERGSNRQRHGGGFPVEPD